MAPTKERPATKTIATNREARHEYFVLEALETGVELKGTEVKSLRAGGVNLKDSWVDIEDGELLDAAAALECGGLARAVVADECADLAGADVQAEVLHGRLAAVGLGQMFDVEHKVPSFVRGSAPLCP